MSYLPPKPAPTYNDTASSPAMIAELRAAAVAAAPTIAGARDQVAALAAADKPIPVKLFDVAYSDQSLEWKMKEKYRLAADGRLAA